MRIIKQAFDDGYAALSSDEFPVDSCSYPELDEDRVWLRGSEKSEDNSTANIGFANTKQAKNYFVNLVRTFGTIEIRYE